MITDEQLKQTVEARLRDANSELAAFYQGKVEELQRRYENELTSLREQVKNVKADFLALQDTLDKHKLNNAYGNASMRGNSRLTRDDYAKVLPAKVAQTPLGEIVRLDAESHGVNIESDSQWQAFINERRPSIAQTLRRAEIT